LVDRKLDSLSCGSCPEVVHSRFQAFLPSIEVHAGELTKRRGLEVDVETLTLADEWPAISGQVDHFLLTDLPNSLVDRFDIVRNARNVLNGAVVGDNHVLHVVVPESKVD